MQARQGLSHTWSQSSLGMESLKSWFQITCHTTAKSSNNLQVTGDSNWPPQVPPIPKWMASVRKLYRQSREFLKRQVTHTFSTHPSWKPHHGDSSNPIPNPISHNWKPTSRQFPTSPPRRTVPSMAKARIWCIWTQRKTVPNSCRLLLQVQDEPHAWQTSRQPPASFQHPLLDVPPPEPELFPPNSRTILEQVHYC